MNRVIHQIGQNNQELNGAGVSTALDSVAIELLECCWKITVFLESVYGDTHTPI